MFHEPRNSFQLWMSKRVGVTGLEPATLWSQTRCATNCATPRLYYHAISRPLKRYRLSPRLSCVCAIFLSFFLNLSQVFFFDCLNSSGYSFKLYITNFLQIYLVFPKQSNIAQIGQCARDSARRRRESTSSISFIPPTIICSPL